MAPVENAVKAVQALITSELDGMTWLVVLDDEGKEQVEDYVRDMIARHVECEPEEVEFVNPHWEAGKFSIDRITFPLKQVHISFEIDS